ncbi:MAG: hypothetical protein NXY57DRAFT_1115128 [Lentinula lateritia]|nr:MAG: hypothetical protein NXY57DRAFT_1115128 [Lentinula lateritia]
MTILFRFATHSFSLFLLFLSTALAVVAAPLTGHATPIAQLEQRDLTYNVCLHRSINGRKPRAKTSAEFRLYGAEEDWMITFGTTIGFKPKQVGHAYSGVWGLQKVEKSYRQGDFLGFLRVEAGKEKPLYRAINEITGATKFEVLDHLMGTINSQSSDIAKFTSNYTDPNAWNDVYLAMTDPIKYTRDGGTKWDVTPLLNALRQT